MNNEFKTELKDILLKVTHDNFTVYSTSLGICEQDPNLEAAYRKFLVTRENYLQRMNDIGALEDVDYIFQEKMARREANKFRCFLLKLSAWLIFLLILIFFSFKMLEMTIEKQKDKVNRKLDSILHSELPTEELRQKKFKEAVNKFRPYIQIWNEGTNPCSGK